MAGDYVKMYHELPDEGAVAAIFEATRVPYDAILGRLFLMWRLFDRMTTDGVLPGMGFHALAAKCGGDAEFWQAVAAAGWLVVTPEGARIPEFEKHFGQSARRRMLGNARVSKHREKQAALQRRYNGVTSVTPEPEPEPVSEPESKKPESGSGVFIGLTVEDLRDDERLLAWARRAARQRNPVIANDYRDLLFVFGAAVRALAVGKKPARLFATIVGKEKRELITCEQEDAARVRLNQALSVKGTRRDADLEGAIAGSVRGVPE